MFNYNANSKVDQITKELFEGTIPQWIRNSPDVDELLPVYMRHIAEYMLSTIERSKLTLIDKSIQTIPNEFILGWYINNILDFTDVKGVVWDEDTSRQYKIYLIERFFELIKKKGTREVISILVSRAGLSVNSIDLYTQNRATKEIVPESSVSDWRELWYSNWDYRKYDPLAKFRVVLEVVSSYEFPYFFLPFTALFDYTRAVLKLSAFYEEYMGTLIKIPALLQPNGRAVISANMIIQVNFGDMYLSETTTKRLPHLNDYLFINPSNIAGDIVYESNELLDGTYVLLEQGHLGMTRRVRKILDCPTEQVGALTYPTSITNNTDDVDVAWGAVGFTINKADGQLTSVTGAWSNVADYNVRFIFGNDTDKTTKIRKIDKVIPQYVNDGFTITRTMTQYGP